MVVRTAEKYDSNQGFNRITRFLHSFRHDIVAEYVAEMAAVVGDRPVRILDVGCATGKTYSILDAGPHRVDYTGFDYNSDYINAANVRYGSKENARFIHANAADPNMYTPDSADMVISLETMEHIPERDVVRAIENICHIVKPRLFVASVPVELGPIIWIKMLGSKAMGYKRTPYSFSQALNAGLYRLNKLPAHQTSHRGFNWFWLEQTIRHNAPIRESRSLPFRWIPKPFTPTVMFVSEPRKGHEGG